MDLDSPLFQSNLLLPQSAVDQWRNLKPWVTSEEEFIKSYGKPDQVQILFGGFDSFQTWQTNNTATR